MRRDEFWTAFTWIIIVAVCVATMFGVVILVQSMLEGR
jgi:uncharacterized membrane protein